MRIRELREACNLSRQELADMMGVVPSCIGNWEIEIALPRVRQLPDLAAALCCTVNDLFVANMEAG